MGANTRLVRRISALTRRGGLIAAHAILVVACASSPEPIATAGTDHPATRAVTFDTDEGTAMSVDVSPDGREITFDILGDIYTLAITGGRARMLAGGRSWDTAPRYSPDGSRIAFVSDSGDGAEGIWTMDRHGDHRELIVRADSPRFPMNLIGAPVWSADGREVAARFGPSSIGVVNVAERTVTRLQLRGPSRRALMGAQNVDCPAFSGDGRFVYFNESALNYPTGRLVRVNRSTLDREVLTDTTEQGSRAHEYRPVVSRSGRLLAFVRYGTDGVSQLVVRDLITDSVRSLRLIPDADHPYRVSDYEESGPNFAFTPDDSTVVLSMRGKLWRVRVSNGAAQEIPFVARVSQGILPPVRPRPRRIRTDSLAVRGIRFAAPADQGRILLFTALGRIHLRDQSTLAVRRLTTSAQTEFAPAVSPDGSLVAYLAYDDPDPRRTPLDSSPRARARVKVARLTSTSEELVTLTPDASDYGPPVWLDSSGLAFSVRDSVARGRRRWVSHRIERGLRLAHEAMAFTDTGLVNRQRLRSDSSRVGADPPIQLTVAIPHSARTLALRGARLITLAGERGRERVIERGTLLVQRGRIVAADEVSRVPIPADAHVMDVTGATIMPGIVDVHLHVAHLRDPRPVPDPDDLATLAYGVTTRFDPSTTSLDADLEHQEVVAAGITPGPRYFYSGRVLSPPEFRITNERDAAALAATYSARGAALLKEYEQDTRGAARLLIDAARSTGIGVTMEGDGLKHMMTRVVDGVGAVEHSAFIKPVFKDVTTVFAAAGTQFTPTLLASSGVVEGAHGYQFFLQRSADSVRLRRFLWPGYFGDRLRALPYSFEQLRLGANARAAKAMIDAGVEVSIGAHNPPGVFSHWEMWALAMGGVSSMEVLRAATVNGARKIGIDADVGTLEPGKVADFIVLAANPLDDIRNTARIRHVMAAGVLYDPDTMLPRPDSAGANR